MNAQKVNIRLIANLYTNKKKRKIEVSARIGIVTFTPPYPSVNSRSKRIFKVKLEKKLIIYHGNVAYIAASKGIASSSIKSSRNNSKIRIKFQG